MNNGFTTFKDSKKVQPLKFEFKNADGNSINLRKKLMKKAIFQENPQLLEFANRQQTNEVTVQKVSEYKKDDPNKLKWGRPFFGIYDRYGGNELNCWMYSGPGNDKGVAQVGQYFITDEPIRVERHGKNYNFIQKLKSVNI